MLSMSKVCTLCSATTSSEDELQLHYLISCPGYNVRPCVAELPARRTVSTRANVHVSGLNTETVLSQSQPVRVQHSPPPPRPAQRSRHKGVCSVKFVWFPQKKLIYPKVTLLASFKVGGTKRDPSFVYFILHLLSVAILNCCERQ